MCIKTHRKCIKTNQTICTPQQTYISNKKTQPNSKRVYLMRHKSENCYFTHIFKTDECEHTDKLQTLHTYTDQLHTPYTYNPNT